MLKEEIIKYLHTLNEKLQKQHVKGEICLYGGAVMCVVYDARPSTKDVDAVFQPTEIIREATKEIADEYDLVVDWLNDGVKEFLVEHPKKVFLNLSHLIVLVADPEYILAMKALSARIDGTDSKDIEFLEVVSKPPLRPNLFVEPKGSILEILNIFLRLSPSARLDLRPERGF